MIEKKNLSILIRIFSYSILALTFIFLINNVLTVWFDWPGVKKLFSHYELFGFKKLNKPLEGLAINLSYIQFLFYFLSFVAVIIFVLKSLNQTLQTDSEILKKITAYNYKIFILGRINCWGCRFFNLIYGCRKIG